MSTVNLYNIRYHWWIYFCTLWLLTFLKKSLHPQVSSHSMNTLVVTVWLLTFPKTTQFRHSSKTPSYIYRLLYHSRTFQSSPISFIVRLLYRFHRLLFRCRTYRIPIDIEHSTSTRNLWYRLLKRSYASCFAFRLSDCLSVRQVSLLSMVYNVKWGCSLWDRNRSRWHSTPSLKEQGSRATPLSLKAKLLSYLTDSTIDTTFSKLAHCC